MPSRVSTSWAKPQTGARRAISSIRSSQMSSSWTFGCARWTASLPRAPSPVDAHSLDRPRVIVLTTFDHDEYVFGALRAGASGFLLKRTPAEELVDAIRIVAEGEALLTPEATRRLVADFAKQNHAPAEARDAMDWLTPREREVLVLIARGLTNREIASSLNVSLETIKTHVKRIFTKIGVHDRAQAVIAAYEARLVAPAP